MGDLSAHFNREEFLCKCGDCGFDTVDAKLLEMLEAVRELFGPVTITSGCRCKAHNSAVGGSTRSQHLLGRAADIVVHGVAPWIIAEFCIEMGFPGVGTYGSWVHIDSRSGDNARWTG